MNEETLLRFIEKIIRSKNHNKIKLSLIELKNILIRNGTDQELIDLLDSMVGIEPEMSELGEQIEKGKKYNRAELDIMIRRGKERLRREEEIRRNSHC